MNETKTASSEELISMNLVFTVVRDVLKRAAIIVAAALFASMLAFVYKDYTYVPEYRAVTTFVVTSSSTSSTTFSNLSAANNTAQVFTEIINSSLLRQKVLEQVGIGYFDGSVYAEVEGNTNLLTMTVKGKDPRLVFLVSKAIIENHSIVSDEVLNGTVLEVLRYPKVPVSPVNSINAKEFSFKAAAAAALITTGVLALISFKSDKIRSKSEADLKLNCYVLGEIRHERKHKTLRSLFSNIKKSVLITDPLTGFIFTEEIYKLSGRIDRRRHKDERVIMVSSVLENEGKSTVAVNLALSYAKKGKKVVIIDCDLRKPACGLILGIKERVPGISDVIQGKTEFENAVKYLENFGVYLLPGKKNSNAASELVNSSEIKEIFEKAKSMFDYVIVDTPPMFVAPDAEYISGYSDAVLMVIKQNEAFAGDINRATDILRKSGAHMLGCVINNVYGSGDFSPVRTYGRYGSYGRYGRYGNYGGYGYYSRSHEDNDEEKRE